MTRKASTLLFLPVLLAAFLSCASAPVTRGVVTDVQRLRTVSGDIFVQITVEYEDPTGATVHNTAMYPATSSEAIRFGATGREVCLTPAGGRFVRLTMCP